MCANQKPKNKEKLAPGKLDLKRRDQQRRIIDNLKSE